MQASEYGIRYPQYIFLFYGWYAKNWWVGTEEEQELLRNMPMYSKCTPEQRASVVPYSLAPLQAEFLDDQNESTIISSGIVSNYTLTHTEWGSFMFSNVSVKPGKVKLFVSMHACISWFYTS